MKKRLKSIPKFVAKKYQDKCIKFMQVNPFAGILLSPGLGKTVIVLMWFKWFKKKNPDAKMLVISTGRILYSVWPSEITKWGLPFKVQFIHKGAKKEKVVKALDGDVFLMTYEGLKWFKKYLGNKPSPFDIMVLDESSKIKNTSTKRFKAIKKLAPKFKYRYILTGSPVPNGLKDIFGQVWFLDLGESLGNYITNFLTTYFFPCGYMGYDWKIQDKADQLIYKRIGHLLIRFGKEELDLPPLHNVYRKIILPDEARKFYGDIETEFIAELDDSLITTKTAATASMMIRQVASGNVYGEGKKPIVVHTEKLLELRELIEEMQGEPLLVAYEFNHELKVLLEEFPDTPFIGKGVSLKKGKEIENAWNAGLLPLMFGQSASIAHGLNLQEHGCTICIYTMPWNLEVYEQLIQRLWRQGQKRPVTAIHLVAEDTIEERVIEVVKKKDYTQKKLLHHIKRYYCEKEGEDMALNDAEWFKDCVERGNLEMPTYKKGEVSNFIEGVIAIAKSWGPQAHTEYLNGQNVMLETAALNGRLPLEELYVLTRKEVLKVFCVEEKKPGVFTSNNVKLAEKYSSKIVKKIPEREPLGASYVDLETKTQEKKMKSNALKQAKEESAAKKPATAKATKKKTAVKPKGKPNAAKTKAKKSADKTKPNKNKEVKAKKKVETKPQAKKSSEKITILKDYDKREGTTRHIAFKCAKKGKTTAKMSELLEAEGIKGSAGMVSFLVRNEYIKVS